jgi:hypothetical protein
MKSQNRCCIGLRWFKRLNIFELMILRTLLKDTSGVCSLLGATFFVEYRRSSYRSKFIHTLCKWHWTLMFFPCFEHGQDGSNSCPFHDPVSAMATFWKIRSLVVLGITHRIHGAAFYGNMDGSHQYTPVMLAYIAAPWILWVRHYGPQFSLSYQPTPLASPETKI